MPPRRSARAWLPSAPFGPGRRSVRRGRGRSRLWRCGQIGCGDQAAGNEAPGDPAEAFEELRRHAVVDIAAAPLGHDGPGLAQDLEMVRDGRLGDVTAIGEIAGADLGRARELAQDLEAGRV